MNAATKTEQLTLTGEQIAVLHQLLETEHAKLLIEIRHTDHRTYRDDLRRRLEMVEQLQAQVRLT